MTEPTTSIGAGGLLMKMGVSAALGVLGAAVMAAVDPPKSRFELFRQALVAGASSMVFGGVAVAHASAYFPNGVPEDELRIAVYFLVGALSWGIAGALVKLRNIIRAKAGLDIYNKTMGTDHHD